MTHTTTRRTASARGSVARRALLLACAALLPVSLLVTAPTAALAAAPQKVTVTPSVGTDRVVSVAVACTGSRACAGSLGLKLSTGGSKTVKYEAKARGSKTLKWTLTAAQYRALTARGSATLTVTGKATKPSKASFTQRATLKPAAAQLSVRGTSYTVPQSRKFELSLKCAAAGGCTASVQLARGGSVLVTRSVQLKQGTHAVAMQLTAAQYGALTEKPAAYALTVRETKPAATQRTTALTLARPATTPEPEPEAPVRTASKAYVERNWTPAAVDTCPVALHESYQTIGPDGKIYPTWHPAQVTDPATGRLCSFGHEHGADPRSSNIFDWVAAFYAPSDLAAGEPVGIPFGYTSEELENYGHEHGGMAMRHEDNAGHKVFVANGVKMLDADRNWLRDAAGNQVLCDVLIKQHQGSWSADATSNNAHESEFAARCTDGTELITSILTRFGNANEMFGTCAPDEPIPTVGSVLPAGDGGRRIIPTTDCVRANPTDWTLYELWESDSKITTADGTVLAAFDPWFGIRNPSRVYDRAASTATTNAISRPLDFAWYSDRPATDYLWAGLAGTERFDYADPRSPFNGAQRDFYLGELQLASGAAQSGIVYSDPYGGSARADRTVGAIRQLIRPGSVLGEVQLSRQKFDAKADFGKNNGVHAPN
ncbi:hypothetical protein [Leucobacter chromiireducens]|uniref:hypothetical protein n=1 Tax=Leucobacter chromiireducens TaxID=283877 RepID=UPI000F6355AC|nr:hypothetical protein [Leucobacter chromiireducens]